MKIIEVRQYADEVLEALNDLLPQLLSSASPLTAEDVNSIIQSQSSRLLMAEMDGRYVGSLTLTMVSIPTGTRAWIDDVVVSEKVRGMGVGSRLIRHALDLAEALGARTVNLTSNPSRSAANALYKKLGFELRETNVYRYSIS
jgi:ribosomal protein S18 acetylase RimI-like enzyme